MLRLAGPVVAIQVGMMLMGVVDTIMVGHVSAVALAAVALGNLYFFGLGVFGMGTLMVLDPVVAQAVGARDDPAVARGIQRGFLIALMIGVPATLLLLPSELFMTLARQPPEVIPHAAVYALRLAPGVLPFFFFIVLRQSLQSMHLTGPIMIAIVVANLVNAALNWMLIFGNLGAPALGVAGSAWATTISRWVLLILVLSLTWAKLRPHLLPLRPEIFQWKPLGRMLRLGLPIGCQYTLEFGAFAFVALMMGWIGTREMAGHQVAINLASLTFMVPLGVADAASILVGHAVGRGDLPGTRGAARAALLCGIGFMSCTAVAFLSMPAAVRPALYRRSSSALDRGRPHPARRRVSGVRRHPDGSRRHSAGAGGDEGGDAGEPGGVLVLRSSGELPAGVSVRTGSQRTVVRSGARSRRGGHHPAGQGTARARSRAASGPDRSSRAGVRPGGLNVAIRLVPAASEMSGLRGTIGPGRIAGSRAWSGSSARSPSPPPSLPPRPR